jgi:hypothetical protein
MTAPGKKNSDDRSAGLSVSHYLAPLVAFIGTFSAQQACLAQVQVTAPPQASSHGYTWTAFSAGPNGTPFSSSSVDVNGTLKPIYQWFPEWFYWNTFTPPIAVTFPTGGGLGTAVINNGGFSSMAAPHAGTSSPSTESGIVGEAFGGGGYFEATFQFNPTDVKLGNGFPAWWGDAEEHLKSGSDPSEFWDFYDTAYTADPGFAHYIETDFMEYNINSGYYAGTLIDWYGDYNKGYGGNPNRYSDVQSPWVDKQLKYPSGTDYSIPHKYGFLWIPAAVSTKGTATFYLDGVPYASQAISWDQYQEQAPYTTLGNNVQPPTPWSWSILDQQHVALIISTGTNEPVTITAIDVWQANANWNIHTGTLYDTLNDLSKVHSSSNIGIGHPNVYTPAADYNGDTAFAERSSLAKGTIVYNLANIKSFTARVFFYGTATPSDFTFTVSMTGADSTWIPVPVSSATPHPVATSGGFSYDDLSNTNPIGSGYNYLQINQSGSTSNTWDMALGQVRIN